MEDFEPGTDAQIRQKENDKYMKGLQKRIENINALELAIEDLGDDDQGIPRSSRQVRGYYGPLLEEAFAVARE
jgi:preprotein translocase subunit SecA